MLMIAQLHAYENNNILNRATVNAFANRKTKKNLEGRLQQHVYYCQITSISFKSLNVCIIVILLYFIRKKKNNICRKCKK